METGKSKATRPELLSPAGDRACLEAAIVNGADAVYLGLKSFNARLNTRNFADNDLPGAVSYAHDRGVRVYLTLNTLVKDHELPAFFNVLTGAYMAGIDGVIIQHLSLLDPIKRGFPGLAVFMSTQSAIGNPAAASLVKKADRIVLPRELPIDQVRKFAEAGIRTEVFVHGALCFSYSGLCLFSSFVGSRSGNRGSCAQLCRQRFNGSYPLSTRELCLVRRIPELIDAGISGFKIEGRMRSPLYVAVATRLYRKAIDSCLRGAFIVPEKELAEIEVVFNREFTEGLLFGSASLTSPQKPMNRGAWLGQAAGGTLTLARPLALGDGLGIWERDGKVVGHIVKELFIGDRRVRSAGAGENVRIGAQLEEGAKVYLTSSGRITIAPDFEIRRPPIAPVLRKRPSAVLPAIEPKNATGQRLLVRVDSLAEAHEAAEAGADVVFLDIFSAEFPGPADWQGKAQLGACLPRLMDDAELASAVGLLRARSPAAILTGNAGLLSVRNKFDLPVYLDYSLNASNGVDIAFFARFQAIPLMSPELSLDELCRLKDKNVVVVCHADVRLMTTMIDPGVTKLKDDQGAEFAVCREHGYWQVLNSRTYGLFEAVNTLRQKGFSQFYIDTPGRAAASVRLYRKILSGQPVNRRARRGTTSGHLFKPVA